MLLFELHSYSSAAFFLAAFGNAEFAWAFLGLALALAVAQSGAHCTVLGVLDMAVGFTQEFRFDISSAEMGGVLFDAGTWSLLVLWHVVLVVGVGFFHFMFVLFPLFPQEKCFPLHQRKLCFQMTSVTMICSCYFLGLSSVC